MLIAKLRLKVEVQRISKALCFSLAAEVDEEDSCPPDLEAVELQQQQQQQQHQPQQAYQQPEPQQQVHQAPPQPSVPQQQDLFAGLDPTSDLVRNLAIAIKVGKLIGLYGIIAQCPFGREGVVWHFTANQEMKLI